VVLLRKSIPQKINLLTAAELGVTEGKKLKASASEASEKQKLQFLKSECFWFFRFGKSCFHAELKNECSLSYASASTSFIAIERMKVLFARC
jgi:hypothetical protein